MICLSKGDMMIKEKYKQLFLPLPFGGIRTMNIHKRYSQVFKGVYGYVKLRMLYAITKKPDLELKNFRAVYAKK